VRETLSEPGSVECVLGRLLSGVLEHEELEAPPWGVTMCAPRWVLERLSNETGLPIDTHRTVGAVATDAVVVTAVPSLEEEAGLGFLAAVDVISGQCLLLEACHPDVAPDRWRDLTLALTYGLGCAAAVTIEMIGGGKD
jgi:hypothetical protein